MTTSPVLCDDVMRASASLQEERELGRAREAELAGRLEKFLLRCATEGRAVLVPSATIAVLTLPPHNGDER